MPTNDDGAWTAPGSGRPVAPDALVAPSAGEIAAQVIRRLVVPVGPVRSAQILLGVSGNTKLALSSTVLNAAIGPQVVLPASGIIGAIDFSAMIVSTAAAAGLLQLIDGNSAIIRNFPISVGAAGTFNIAYSTDTEIPFINGLSFLWTPLLAAFGATIINVNLDYQSIPIGQRTLDN